MVVRVLSSEQADEQPLDLVTLTDDALLNSPSSTGIKALSWRMSSMSSLMLFSVVMVG